MTLRKITFLMSAIGVCALSAPVAQAETVLRISSWAPPTHFVNSKIWPEWGAMVEKATEGRVKTKIEYKLASPPKQFGVVRDGIADAAWIFHGYNTRYVATQAVEMPGLGTSGEAAAVAYWQVHQKYLKKANEHRGVVLIGLHSHGPAVIHTKKPLKSLADLKGLKIRVPAGVGSLVGRALGVTAVKLPAPKVYEALSSGVTDGVFMPMETQKSFRLKEVVPNVTIMPGGLYYGSFGFILNPRLMAKLSKKDQAAIMSVSGAEFAKLGRHWDRADDIGREDAIKSGTKITVASDAIKADYYARMKPIEDAWVKQTAKWFDGKAVLAELRATARAYEKSKK
jgi:TRAP-type C4-dicarboxylate transport system substrate-binding protein